jgi:hypothetical protein
VAQRKQGRGWDGHFLGFRARLNCENMPVIPAWLVRSNLNDPRKIPYLLIWKDARHSAEIKEAVRLARYVDPHDSSATNNHVEIKRTDGSITVLRFVWRMLPRNGGRALLLACSYCNTPRRHVYGWEWDNFSGWSNRVRNISWRCRSCARLRYSSEGGYLCGPRMFRALGNLPRPESWPPYVFTSIDDPRLDEIVRQNQR